MRQIFAGIFGRCHHRLSLRGASMPSDRGSSMHAAFSLLPLVAAVLAVPQFLPQLARLRRTGETAGVSWSWAALTSINNAAWAGYFALSGFWTALVPAISATVLAGTLAVMLARRGARRPAPPRGARAGVDRAAHRRRRPVRPRGPGHGADRRLPAAGHALGLDGVPGRPHARASPRARGCSSSANWPAGASSASTSPTRG